MPLISGLLSLVVPATLIGYRAIVSLNVFLFPLLITVFGVCNRSFPPWILLLRLLSFQVEYGVFRYFSK